MRILQRLFTARDRQIVRLLAGSECGGTAGGEQVCFAYDRKEDTWKRIFCLWPVSICRS